MTKLPKFFFSSFSSLCRSNSFSDCSQPFRHHVFDADRQVDQRDQAGEEPQSWLEQEYHPRKHDGSDAREDHIASDFIAEWEVGVFDVADYRFESPSRFREGVEERVLGRTRFERVLDVEEIRVGDEHQSA